MFFPLVDQSTIDSLIAFTCEKKDMKFLLKQSYVEEKRIQFDARLLF
jgi:hypothetical protein